MNTLTFGTPVLCSDPEGNVWSGVTSNHWNAGGSVWFNVGLDGIVVPKSHACGLPGPDFVQADSRTLVIRQPWPDDAARKEKRIAALAAYKELHRARFKDVTAGTPVTWVMDTSREYTGAPPVGAVFGTVSPRLKYFRGKVMQVHTDHVHVQTTNDLRAPNDFYVPIVDVQLA